MILDVVHFGPPVIEAVHQEANSVTVTHGVESISVIDYELQGVQAN